MAQILQSHTSTLKLKLPSDLYVPPFQDKVRTKKSIVKTIVQILQTKQLELLYVGLQNDVMNNEEYGKDSEGIFVSVNIINDPVTNYNASQEMLLKRFKRELQHNSEHILIDKTSDHNGKYLRTIDIYIRSRHADKVITPTYPFPGNAPYQYSVA